MCCFKYMLYGDLTVFYSILWSLLDDRPSVCNFDS